MQRYPLTPKMCPGENCLARFECRKRATYLVGITLSLLAAKNVQMRDGSALSFFAEHLNTAHDPAAQSDEPA